MSPDDAQGGIDREPGITRRRVASLGQHRPEMAASGREQYGKLLNTWRAIMHRPTLFEAYLRFLRQVAGPGDLDPKLKDLTAVLVGWLNGCRYTVSHRCTSAMRSGATEAELVAISAGDWSAFDTKEQLAPELTKQMTVGPPTVQYGSNPVGVDGELLERISSLFDEAQIVELTMSIAVWNALSRFHRVMDFDLDMPASPPYVDPLSSR